MVFPMSEVIKGRENKHIDLSSWTWASWAFWSIRNLSM